MAIRPPKYSDLGFTLIEMLVTIAITGIIMGIATPSLMSLNKPLRDGSLQFKSQLSLIRSKAISSNKAYRLRPKFSTLTVANYPPNGIARNFVVEYAANCRVPENTAPPAPRWQMASEFDLDLPQNVGIPSNYTGLPTVVTAPTNPLDWNSGGTQSGKGICFDKRGIVHDTTTKITLKDFQGNNKAKLAVFEITKIGNIDITAYNFRNAEITASQGNPEF